MFFCVRQMFSLCAAAKQKKMVTNGAFLACEGNARNNNQKLESSYAADARQHGIYLTNKFHVAVRLFSNRSQMTSKCGKNKKVAHEAIAECVTDVLTTF